MDRILDWLSTEFPPGWFDGMELAPDWLSVVNFVLVAFLGWKTLGPRRRTKLKLMLSNEHVGLNGEVGYRMLIVLNQGHYPANGVQLVHETKAKHVDLTLMAGDILPWRSAGTATLLRNYELDKFRVTYRDADTKLIRKRLRISPGSVLLSESENKKVSMWISKKIGSKEERRIRNLRTKGESVVTLESIPQGDI